jgi:DNA-binding Lrp family transcriptional regulator
LGVSQSAIATRLRKLKESGLFDYVIGINLGKLGLQLSRVDASADDPNAIVEWAKRCPLFINASLGIGGENLTLYLVSEDMDMFQHLVEGHIRKLRGVTNIVFSSILHWAKKEHFPLLLELPKKETPPCGTSPYCPKCPSNPRYDGKLWTDSRDSSIASRTNGVGRRS